MFHPQKRAWYLEGAGEVPATPSNVCFMSTEAVVRGHITDHGAHNLSALYERSVTGCVAHVSDCSQTMDAAIRRSSLDNAFFMNKLKSKRYEVMTTARASKILVTVIKVGPRFGTGASAATMVCQEFVFRKVDESKERNVVLEIIKEGRNE